MMVERRGLGTLGRKGAGVMRAPWGLDVVGASMRRHVLRLLLWCIARWCVTAVTCTRFSIAIPGGMSMIVMLVWIPSSGSCEVWAPWLVVRIWCGVKEARHVMDMIA